MSTGGEGMDSLPIAPSSPGAQIRQVRPGRRRRVSDQEGGGQPPERIGLGPGGKPSQGGLRQVGNPDRDDHLKIAAHLRIVTDRTDSARSTGR